MKKMIKQFHQTKDDYLEEKEIVRQTKEKIECNMQGYIEAFVD